MTKRRPLRVSQLGGVPGGLGGSLAFWFRLDDNFADHPKTAALEAALSDPNAGMYVVRFWTWLCRFQRRGTYAANLAEHIERACHWRGESGKLVAELISVGFIDDRQNGDHEGHDWWEKQSSVVEKAEKDAARKRKERRARVRVTSRGPSADAAPVRLSSGAGTRRDETRRDGRDERDATTTATAVEFSTILPPTISGPADDFWNWSQGLREKAGCVRESAPEPRALSSWYSVAMMELQGDDGRLREGWMCFGDDPHWQKATPACPFRAFMNAETGWRRFVPRIKVRKA